MHRFVGRVAGEAFEGRLGEAAEGLQVGMNRLGRRVEAGARAGDGRFESFFCCSGVMISIRPTSTRTRSSGGGETVKGMSESVSGSGTR